MADSSRPSATIVPRFIDPTVILSDVVEGPNRIEDFDFLIDYSVLSSFTNGKESSLKRRLVSGEALRLIDFFRAEGCFNTHILKVDDGTFITSTLDQMLELWNIKEFKQVKSIRVGVVYGMTITKDKSVVMCGLGGRIELRRTSDLKLLRTISFKNNTSIRCICELEDGTFVSGSWSKLKRWDIKGTKLQTYSEHKDWIVQVEGLKRGEVIVSTAGSVIKTWNTSTGECLHTLTSHTKRICTLITLSEVIFATGSEDKTIRVWGERGCIETINAAKKVNSIAVIGDFLVSTSCKRLKLNRYEVRKLK